MDTNPSFASISKANHQALYNTSYCVFLLSIKYAIWHMILCELRKLSLTRIASVLNTILFSWPNPIVRKLNPKQTIAISLATKCCAWLLLLVLYSYTWSGCLRSRPENDRTSIMCSRRTEKPCDLVCRNDPMFTLALIKYVLMHGGRLV